jgi:hypothetical protein
MVKKITKEMCESVGGFKISKFGNIVIQENQELTV